MCGVAGFVSAQAVTPEEARRRLEAMAHCLAHRGPDGAGFWVEEGAALAHRRLSIIDLEGGAQPMTDATGRLVITYNGELYNYRELRETLLSLGCVFHTRSDTEVLLNAYLRWGEACLDCFEGMFAFAIWDRERRRLFAARDRFGKKPFFYTLQRGVFAFASEATALAQLAPLAGLSLTVARQTLARFLAYEYAPTPECVYEQARKLEPSHFLLLEDGAVTIHRYWDMPAPAPERVYSAAEEDSLCEELRRLLLRAVERRLVSDVPLGVCLSGGVDSSAVAAAMARRCDHVRTFSIAFAEDSYDESRYARAVARRLATDHYEHVLSAQQCGMLLPTLMARFDEPLADPSVVPTSLLAEVTRREVTVALGGDGPDELFAGYEYFTGFRHAQRLLKIPGIMRLPWETLARRLPASSGYVNLRFAAGMFLAGLRAPTPYRTQRWLTAFAPEDQQTLWADPTGLDLSLEGLFGATRALFEHHDAEDDLARVAYVLARQYMLDYILVKVDRCSMAHSLEMRAPFLDRALAEFVCRLPMSLRLRGNTRKYLLKKAVAPWLPPEVLHRPKRGFLIPVAGWLRGALRPMVEELTCTRRLKEQGLFAPSAVRRMVDTHMRGEADHRKALWTMLTLQLWLRAHNPTVRV